LSIRQFNSVSECIKELYKTGYELWTAEFHADSRRREFLQCAARREPARYDMLPRKLALVIGNEETAMDAAFKAAARKHIYLPLRGCTGEYPTLSVASALLLQHIFHLAESGGKGDGFVGSMGEEERQELRANWYMALAKSDLQKQEYVRYIDSPPAPLDDLRTPDVSGAAASAGRCFSTNFAIRFTLRVPAVT
jgi:hypothetical protein